MDPLDKYTFDHLLERMASRYATYPAVARVNEEPITYAVFYNRVQAISRFLEKEGIKKGDRVAIVSENMPNWDIAYFAIVGMGAVAVPVLPDFHINEIRHIIRHAECKAVFTSNRFIDEIDENEIRNVHTIIRINDFKVMPRISKKDLWQDILDMGDQEFNKLKKTVRQLAGKEVKPEEAEIREDDLAVIIYTSGTTGNSKGVMLTHKNILFDAVSATSIIEPNTQDRFLSILPLAHTYECTIGMIIPLMFGSCIYYLDRPPTPTILTAALARVKPTIMLSVPLVIEKIYKMRILPEFQKNRIISGLYKWPFIRRKLNQIAGKKLLATFGGQIRFFGIGGAALAPEAERFLMEANFPYAIGYGLTETSPLIAGMGPHQKKLRSTGPVLPGIEIKIENQDADNGEGEIRVRGANVMKGYYKDPDQTREVLSEDGWFRTGDLGVLDQDGYLYIKGRSKNMIVGPSGENIYPEQIEALLNEFDCILESLVYQDGGKLTARVYLDYEKLDQKFGVQKMTEKEVRTKIAELLKDIRIRLNERVSAFSRLQNIIEQTQPFEKTPTQKIKRFLYIEPGTKG